MKPSSLVGARVRLDVGGPAYVSLYGTVQSTTRTRAEVLWDTRTTLDGREELRRPLLDEVRLGDLVKVEKET
jgi:hypothetical protein